MMNAGMPPDPFVRQVPINPAYLRRAEEPPPLTKELKKNSIEVFMSGVCAILIMAALAAFVILASAGLYRLAQFVF